MGMGSHFDSNPSLAWHRQPGDSRSWLWLLTKRLMRIPLLSWLLWLPHLVMNRDVGDGPTAPATPES